MRVALLGVAASLAAATFSAPAGAQVLAFGGQSSPSFHGQFGAGHGEGYHHSGRRNRGSDGILILDRDYQGDSAWRHDSFNDWWHERPQRSYPAWMSRNENCERQWWSGTTLRC